MTVVLDGDPFTIEEVIAVARNAERVDIDPSIAQRMAPGRQLVEQAEARSDVVYGITTGFGALASVHIGPERV
ncbi:MAG: aromatic amino acid lyase, partial [Actinomycetota bacterium]